MKAAICTALTRTSPRGGIVPLPPASPTPAEPDEWEGAATFIICESAGLPSLRSLPGMCRVDHTWPSRSCLQLGNRDWHSLIANRWRTMLRRRCSTLCRGEPAAMLGWAHPGVSGGPRSIYIKPGTARGMPLSLLACSRLIHASVHKVA